MSYLKILELENKFIKKIADSTLNERFKEQREKLSKFYFELTGELKSLLTEMSGDYAALRAKGLDHKTLEVFKEFRQQLIHLMKDIDPERPYVGGSALIAWMKDNMNKSILDNLNFIIQEFLKQNKIDFIPTAQVKPLRVDSLIKLKNLLKSAEDFIIENPLLPDPREQSTVPPPRLRNVKEELFTPFGGESKTNPSIPAPKPQS